MKRILPLPSGAAVALSDSGILGMRIVAGTIDRRCVSNAVTLARTKPEARDLIAKLRDLLQDLPDSAPDSTPGTIPNTTP